MFTVYVEWAIACYELQVLRGLMGYSVIYVFDRNERARAGRFSNTKHVEGQVFYQPRYTHLLTE